MEKKKVENGVQNVSNDREYIPIDWLTLVCCVLCVLGCVYLFLNPERFGTPVTYKYLYLLVGALSTFITLKQAKSFRIGVDGITIYMLGIRIRNVRWNEVLQIGVSRRASNTECIIVSLYGSEEFNPYRDTGRSYIGKNRFHVFTIENPKKNAEKVVKYYGELDYGW